MLVVRGKEAGGLPAGPRVFALGTFDGVHRGHTALLREARELASRLGPPEMSPWALTFHPHPARVLAPTRAPRCIGDLEDRLAWLEAAGAAGTWVVPFDRELAALEPGTFFRDLLLAGGARGLVVGHDFTFGRARAGTGALLLQLGEPEGIAVKIVSPVRTAEGTVISSTEVRRRISAGDLPGAREMLGRWPEVSGEISPGAGRGAGIGFATANLSPEERVIPGRGVYAGWGRVKGEQRAFPAAVNVGEVPTFGELEQSRIEAHLVGRGPGSLAGQQLQLAFLRRLRGERRFDGVEALVAQIRQDVAETELICGALPRPAWVGEGA